MCVAPKVVWNEEDTDPITWSRAIFNVGEIASTWMNGKRSNSRDKPV